MTIKELFKAWKKELKEQDLWNEVVWEQPITEGDSRITVTCDKEGSDHLEHIRLGFKSSADYGIIPYVGVKK